MHINAQEAELFNIQLIKKMEMYYLHCNLPRNRACLSFGHVYGVANGKKDPLNDHFHNQT